MRQWHRWLAVLFGVFILWIATTGFLSQVGTLVNNGGFEEERAAPAATAGIIPTAQAHEAPAAASAPEAAAAPAEFVCPETMTCRPKRPPPKWNVGYLHHLHSGEEFGPAGVIVSMLSGLALIFFALSGLYLYIQMFRGRLVRTEAGKTVRGGKFFW